MKQSTSLKTFSKPTSCSRITTIIDLMFIFVRGPQRSF